MNVLVKQSFLNELEKITSAVTEGKVILYPGASPFAALGSLIKTSELRPYEPENKAAKRRWRRRAIVGTAGAGAGLAAGSGVTYLAAPAILKALGGVPSPRARRILTALAGLSSAAVLGSIGAYASAPPTRTARELRPAGAVQSEDGELAERHEGHPTSFPTGSFLSNASGRRVLPLSAGAGTGVDGQRGDGDKHLRRRKREYGFRGKTPRNYSFERSVRVREYEP